MGGLVLHPAPRASFTLDQGGEATFTITDEQGGQLVIAASNAKMVMPASTQATMAIVSESLQGPAGVAGGSSFTETAGVALSALRAVRLQAGAVQTVDAATLGHAQSCIGITTTAAALGAAVTIQASGFIDVSGMVAGLPVYVGLDGQLTQTPPVVGFLLKLGHAVSATRMFVQIERSIKL